MKEVAEMVGKQFSSSFHVAGSLGRIGSPREKMLCRPSSRTLQQMQVGSALQGITDSQSGLGWKEP